FPWDPKARPPNAPESGCYVTPAADPYVSPSGSESLSRTPPSEDPGGSPDARQFEERLRRIAREGAFLALLAHPRDYPRARERVGRDGLPGLWLLIPSEEQALIDGKPVPIVTPGQRVEVPSEWVANASEPAGRGAAGAESTGPGSAGHE